MNSDTTFHPPRLGGYLVNGGLALVLVLGAGYGLWQVTRAEIGPQFLLALLPALAAAFGLPLLGYRLYGLATAYYALERDGLRLRWGLRWEDIPMNTVTWVRPAAELPAAPPLPLLRWPGAVVGQRRLDAGNVIEFMAARGSGLVFIGTPGRVYAISPADPQAFMNTYWRFSELGSLAPIAGRSVYPSFLLGRVWDSSLARSLLVSGLVMSLALTIWVSLAIPGREQVFLGFQADGTPRDLTPAVRLLLLPFLNAIIVLANLFLGLFFFRQESSQPLAFLVWLGCALTPLLFLVGVFFILFPP